MEVPGKKDTDTPLASEIFGMFCTPCTLDNRNETAHGYCEICKEYLCQNCVDCHRRFRMTKNHKILIGADMPSESSGLSDIDFSCTIPCEQHPGEVIKYICQTHDIVGCGPCTTINHRTCKVDFIPDIAKNSTESTEYKTLMGRIKEIENQLSKLETLIESSRKVKEDIHTTSLKDIREFRAKINEYLDKKEEEILAESKQLNKENEKVLQNIIESRDKLKRDLEDMKNEINRHTEDLANLIIVSKLNKQKFNTLVTSCSALINEIKIKHYTFKASDTINEIISSGLSYGVLEFDFSRLNLTIKDRVGVAHSSDPNQRGPFIPGLCLLSLDTLLAADSYNKALKMVHISRLKITSIHSVDLTSRPWGVTCLLDDQAAVTLPVEKKIQIVSTRGRLAREREIKVSAHCLGVCYSDGKLLVTYNNPDKLEIMGLDGTVYKTVTTDYKGKKVFTEPMYITLLSTNTGKYIYVSDYYGVSKLTMEGEVVNQLQDQRFSPRGLVALGVNHLAVCSYKEKNIAVIRDKDGKMEISKQWNCVANPMAIAFSSLDNVLYVSKGGNYDRSNVYAYELA